MRYKLNKKKYSVHGQILDAIPEGASVLEVGTAQGYITKILKEEKNCVVTGVEIDRKSAEIAAQFCKKIFVGDIEKREFDEIFKESYDVVLCLDVVEHLASPEEFLRRLVTLENRKTVFYFSVPNVVNFVVRAKVFFGNFTYTKTGILDETHLHFYTKKTFKSLLQKVGFVVEQDYAVPQLPFSRLGKLGYILTRLRPTLMSSHIMFRCK